MRRVRLAVVVLFVLSLIGLGGYIVFDKITRDTTPPVMSCDSESITVSVEADEKELLKGVSARDNKDGDLTDSVRIASMSRFTENGKRTIRYVVFDSSNNAAEISREVQYTDYTPPQIQLSEALRYKEEDLKELDMGAGMTATDCLDGDITNKIRAGLNDDVYIDGPGTYALTAQVSNSAGDTCVVPLELTVVDSENRDEGLRYYPMLSQYIVYTKKGQKIDPASYLQGLEHNGTGYFFGDRGLSDADAGDVSVNDQTDYNTPGTYTVEYTYTSKDGITGTTKLTVVVEE